MKRLPFIPQLDSFRFFAVALVMFQHWLPTYQYLPWGQLGVIFFFVLSGYLISSNLLFLKLSIEDGEISRWGALKLFYARRTLRIFPLYYLVLIVMYLVASPMFEGKLVWYLAYVPNFLVCHTESWPEMTAHFWSLGVEEQFYLIWPLLIFLVGWRNMKYLFPTMIGGSILFKAIIYFSHGSVYNVLLPWSNFDAFGIGAMLAYLPYTRFRDMLSGKWSFVLGVALSLVPGMFFQLRDVFFIYSFFISIASFFIIRKAQKGFSGTAGKILNLPVLRYLGKISYGLYVYHLFMPWLWRCLTGREDKFPIPSISFLHGVSWASKPAVILCAQFLLLVGISSLSWYFFERPFNNLKHGFGISKRPALATT